MIEHKRQLDINKLLKLKSFFLFGPRSTGKSTLIHQQLPTARLYDLLDAEVYRRLLARPRLLAEENPKPNTIIVIDEIQKYPELLDEVHRLIETKHLRFLLTGSSTRKLKRGGVNLLAGRAWQANLFPLTVPEIDDFDLLKYLNRGGLPQVYTSSHPREELASYVGTYLQEEIQAEALTRNVPGFSRFLDVIALACGHELNFQNLASDAMIPASTLKQYIEILEDTLVGFRLPAFVKTKKRKAISRSKFYLFDVGVTNHLAKRSKINWKSELFGFAFEQFIITQTRAILSYLRAPHELQYWRSTSQFEVDLIIEEQVAIEIKSTQLVQDKHLKSLRKLKEEDLLPKYIVVSLDPHYRVTSDGIEIWPWQAYIDALAHKNPKLLGS